MADNCSPKVVWSRAPTLPLPLAGRKRAKLERREARDDGRPHRDPHRALRRGGVGREERLDVCSSATVTSTATPNIAIALSKDSSAPARRAEWTSSRLS